ncbi:MAG: hypothetical protein ACLFV5_08685, partial [Anaerolineales bacterium]
REQGTLGTDGIKLNLEIGASLGKSKNWRLNGVGGFPMFANMVQALNRLRREILLTRFYVDTSGHSRQRKSFPP